MAELGYLRERSGGTRASGVQAEQARREERWWLSPQLVLQSVSTGYRSFWSTVPVVVVLAIRRDVGLDGGMAVEAANAIGACAQVPLGICVRSRAHTDAGVPGDAFDC